MDDNSTGWAESSTYTWPAPPNTQQETAPEPADSSHDKFFALEAVEVAAELPASETDETAANEPRVEAERLLDELRSTIALIASQPGAGIDLSGVISDLEVAVTPPGALAPDDLTELRDALLAARERPRDVDTIVDLTRRLDALVALVIAYDRTLAAIERSLDVLRGTGTREDEMRS
jgi:hypothetical protein